MIFLDQNGSKPIEQALHQVNRLASGSPVVIHTDIAFIIIKCKISVSSSSSDICAGLIDMLRRHIESDIILLPSFSYSYPKTRIYDVMHDIPNTGQLPAFACQLLPSKRTHTPLINFVNIGHGSLPNELIKSEYAYGCKSLYDWLIKQDSLVVFWGCSAGKVNTFMHHIECMNEVPYMFEKKFPGELFVPRQEAKSICLRYFCRYRKLLDVIKWSDQGRSDLLSHDQLYIEQRIALEYYQMQVYADLIGNKIRKDPFCLLSKECKDSVLSFLASNPQFE
jgi:aminoglycoside N3'-acetyltransferase